MGDTPEALVFDTQRFSLHDGPGIRTLLFFKGCPLSCRWCANPEGISHKPEIRNDRRRCTGCGNCVRSCPFGAAMAGPEGVTIDRDRCQKCGACIEGCAAGALRWWGEHCSVEKLADTARRDAPFYESSGGGVTLGGGDPLLQKEAAVALLRRCKNLGLNTAIETAGNYPFENLEAAAPHCDTIHFDLKAWNPDTSRACIGADGRRIYQNLQKLDALLAGAGQGPALVVRIPLLPGCNFTPEDFEQLAAFLQKLRAVSAIEILPFHNLGENKYAQLDRAYPFKGRQNLRAEDVEDYRQILERAVLPVHVTTM